MRNDGRRRVATLASLVAVVIAVAVGAAATLGGEGSAPSPSTAEGGDRATPTPPAGGRAEEPVEGALEELEEQVERTEERLEALEAARAAGTLGAIERIRTDPAPGWVGERLLHPTADDWEPAVAADPNRRFVYVLTTRYGGERACRNRCPDPAIILRASRDGGRTWRDDQFLCRCKGVRSQHDPLIEVVPETGDVYAAWMNSFEIQFARSSDHGRTWSDRVFVHRGTNWGDKPILAVGSDGDDVYLQFNGPTSGDVHVASSHDGGATWSTIRLTRSERYFYHYGGVVLPGGRVLFSLISFSYSGPDGEAEGPVTIHLFTSDDGGATWTEQVLDELELGTVCRSVGCYRDFYDSGPALAADGDGDLLIVYNGAAQPGGNRTVYARSSADGGATWTERVRLSRVGVNAAFPFAAGGGDGDFRVAFADQRTGAWNVRYRTTEDGGVTWSKAVRISDAFSGTAYKEHKGFAEFYGDYGELAITSRGDTFAAWGEGPSYFGPGGTWFNRQR